MFGQLGRDAMCLNVKSADLKFFHLLTYGIAMSNVHGRRPCKTLYVNKINFQWRDIKTFWLRCYPLIFVIFQIQVKKSTAYIKAVIGIIEFFSKVVQTINFVMRDFGTTTLSVRNVVYAVLRDTWLFCCQSCPSMQNLVTKTQASLRFYVFIV